MRMRKIKEDPSIDRWTEWPKWTPILSEAKSAPESRDRSKGLRRSKSTLLSIIRYMRLDSAHRTTCGEAFSHNMGESNLM